MNPILKDLGYAPDDRVVIFHADDVGMCQSTLVAYEELVDFGLLSSASVMVPCPWFSGVAAIARQHKDIDMGVHLTITCEWDHYRWGAVSTTDKTTGLLDDEGFLYRDCESIQLQANPEAVTRELNTQIERALAAGIDATHIDSHMGALFHEKFLRSYIDMGLKHRVPMLLSRQSEAEMQAFGMSDAGVHIAQQLIEKMDRKKIGVFDHIFMMELEEVWQDGVAQTIDGIEKIPPGLTYFIVHPACDSSELRAIAPDWRARVRDYTAFKSPILRDYVHNAGIHVIGYKILRDRMRG